MEPKAGHYDYKIVLEDVQREILLSDQDEGDFIYLLPRNRHKDLAAYDPYNLQAGHSIILKRAQIPNSISHVSYILNVGILTLGTK